MSTETSDRETESELLDRFDADPDLGLDGDGSPF